jgi:hypothetical protein
MWKTLQEKDQFKCVNIAKIIVIKMNGIKKNAYPGTDSNKDKCPFCNPNFSKYGKNMLAKAPIKQVHTSMALPIFCLFIYKRSLF